MTDKINYNHWLKIATTAFLILLTTLVIINVNWAGKEISTTDSYLDQIDVLSFNNKIDQDSNIQAWFFSEKAGSMDNIQDFYFDTLKPEWYNVDANGLKLKTTQFGVSGFSEENMQILNDHSDTQILMVRGDYPEAFEYIKNNSEEVINEIVEFANENNFEGVEIDFEKFWEWDAEIEKQYVDFLNQLKDRLDQENMILSIAILAKTDDNLPQYPRYSELAKVEVDEYNIMLYDYQYTEVGPIADMDWATKSLELAEQFFPKDKIVVGLPMYGYSHNQEDGYEYFNIDFDSPEGGQRLDKSGELYYTNEGKDFYVSDLEAVKIKLEYYKSLGYHKFSIWSI